MPQVVVIETFLVLSDRLHEQPEKESTGTMQRGAMICRYSSPNSLCEGQWLIVRCYRHISSHL